MFNHKNKKSLMKIINNLFYYIYSFIKKLNPSFIFYKYFYRRKILESKPIICNQKSKLEIHIITSKKDFLDAFWALKTLYYYSGLRPKLIVHEDGSLSSNKINLILNHFKGSEVIKKKKADKEMDKFLSEFPNLRKFRKKKDFYCAMKLLDILRYSKSENLLLIDSDVLFFKKPDEIIDCIKRKKSFFNSDYQDAYVEFTHEFLKTKKLSIMSKINAGLIYIEKKLYLKNLKLMDDYFKYIYSFKLSPDVNRHEQTLHAILLSKVKAYRLSRNYQISNQIITKETISHHFVHDGNRHLLYTKGLKKLKYNNFL